MVSGETIKAYRGNYVPGGGYPVALVAAGIVDLRLVAEYFLFVGDKESTFYSQRIFADSANIPTKDPEHPKAIDPEFILEFAAHVAEEKLNNHLYETNAASSEPGFWDQPYKLAGISLEEIAFLRLQDRYTRQLESLSQHTSFPLLSRLADQIYRLGKAIFREVT